MVRVEAAIRWIYQEMKMDTFDNYVDLCANTHRPIKQHLNRNRWAVKTKQRL